MTSITVVKRDGSREPLQPSKIDKVIQWASQGLDVDLQALLEQANLMFFEGIETSVIHDSLIKAATALITVEKPDYQFLAARLLLQKLYKQTVNDVRYPRIRSYIMQGVVEKRLNPELLTKFDLEELDLHIVQSRDLLFDYVGMQTLVDRYLIRETVTAGKDGKIIELPQHFWMRVAMGLSLNEDEPTRRAIEFYNVLSKLEYIASTPTLFNSGTNHSQMSSCYLNTVTDSLSSEDGENRYASIYGTMDECARLSKFAGGIGTDWTAVRSQGQPIFSTNGKSSGIVPYLKVFNDTAVAVNQCFAPETLVRVADGVKQIKDVEVGDLVLGQRGIYREVRKVMSYEQKDAMVSLKVKHSLNPLIVTSGHPIYAIKSIALGQSISRTLAQIQSGKYAAEWVDAGELEVGDYVAQVVPSEVVPVSGFTEEDARMYGIMLGDGHCSIKKSGYHEYGVTGSSAEEETLVFVAEYLTKREVNFSYTQVGSGATQIRWSFSGKRSEVRDTAGRFVIGMSNCLPFDHDDLYDTNGDKRIARRLMHLPLPQALAIVQGLIDSDGCVSRGKEVTFTNTSIQLVEGLRYQMLRLGVPTSGNVKVRGNEHLGYDSITTAWEVRIPAITELAALLGIPELTKFNWFRQGNLVFSRVTEVRQITAVPTVYDLKVDGDSTYMTTAGLVHNGGKRNGAFAAYLEPWHPDFEDFIDLKKNSGDERRRTHDIFPAGWNNDLLMQRVEQGGLWSFFAPDQYPELHELYGEEFKVRYEQLEAEGKFVRQVPAEQLWRKWMNSLYETGHPWVTFKDECNRRNPQDHVGVVHCSNLCTEITLNTSADETAVCNLGSINLARVNTEADFRRVVPIAIRMLDNVIDLNYYPSSRALNSNMRHRPIGLGVMGYAELLAQRGIDWESQEHLNFANALFETISFYAIGASAKLAGERGAYASYEGSKWSRNILPIDTAIDHTELGLAFDSLRDWGEVRALIAENGMRNSNVMAIAPTATISNIAGTTPTVEPIFKRQFSKTNLSGQFTVIDPSLRWAPAHLCKTAFEIDQTWVIKRAAVTQRWVDQAQSLNLFAKFGTKGRTLSDWYFLAWRLKCKTTYYLRTQSAEADGGEVIKTVAVAVVEPEPKVCSINNPDCESCQ
ncbi:ribonucleoside-diphosphate reductase subunit alpha [Methylobacillus sp.]|uniref:ribonucleoside-diphosphate reductase subunit alpha n=1 Tax=Methylobacillus sp. TaxID=56818 RepID=UPI0012C1F6D0|nr:ribonucleoside-diphosphate reductase subunit alpha [Methylobacillus sp.]MPS48485.1 ribonucleoside-diphosphate reductase subunit alpha [Methylobacillus sp.]